MTIRQKLVLWYAGLLTVIIILFGITIFMMIRASMVRSIDELLDTTASKTIHDIAPIPVGQFGVPATRIRFRSDAVFHIPGVSVQVWERVEAEDGNGYGYQLVQASTNLFGFDQPLDMKAIESRTYGYTDVMINSVPGRVVTRLFTAGGREVGVVQVATSTMAIQVVAQNLLYIVVAASFVAIIFVVALSLWLSNRVLRPIENIIRAASRISATQDLTTRLSWKGPSDELGRLAGVFNHMMERLEHHFKVQQRFVADVSHELRTPLTAIQGNLQLMERYGLDVGGLEAIARESERMSRMVNNLLLLARADYGELHVDLEPIDLDTVVLESFEEMQALMQTKSRLLKLKLSPFEPARINGHAGYLQHVFTNLLGNAIKFTSDGGTIRLGLYVDDGYAHIEVSDTGIGIDGEKIQHIFERFYQADDARVSRSGEEGSGLGLSIVKWIVDVHEGTIDVDSKPGVGTDFTVKIPLLSDEPDIDETELERSTALRFPKLPSFY